MVVGKRRLQRVEHRLHPARHQPSAEHVVVDARSCDCSTLRDEAQIGGLAQDQPQVQVQVQGWMQAQVQVQVQEQALVEGD